MRQAMKRAIVLVAALALSCGMLAGSAWAAGTTAKVTVGDAKAESGQVVTIPVSIANNPGVAGFALQVTLPEGAKLSSIEKGSIVSSGNFSSDTDTLRANWFADENITENGVLFEMKVTAPAEPGAYEVAVGLTEGKEANFANQDFESVPVEFAFGTLTVEGDASTAKDISDCTITLAPKSYTYDGKAKTPAVKVKLDDADLKEGVDYEVAYANNKTAGTAKATISGLGAFVGSKTTTFKIAPAANPFAIAKATRTVKVAKVKKKNQSVAGPAVKKKAQGTVTYTIAKVSKAKFKKNFSIAKKTGKITVKKKTPKGTYKVTVKATAAGNKNYKKSSAKKAVVTIKVK